MEATGHHLHGGEEAPPPSPEVGPEEQAEIRREERKGTSGRWKSRAEVWRWPCVRTEGQAGWGPRIGTLNACLRQVSTAPRSALRMACPVRDSEGIEEEWPQGPAAPALVQSWGSPQSRLGAR